MGTTTLLINFSYTVRRYIKRISYSSPVFYMGSEVECGWGAVGTFNLLVRLRLLGEDISCLFRHEK